MTKRRPLFIGILLIILIGFLIPHASTFGQSIPSISIITPGDGSVLTSPIHIAAELNHEASSLVRIALINDKNITIARKLLRIDKGEDNAIRFETDLYFEIPIEATEALLTVSTLDDSHRIQSLRSVTLNINAEGQSTVQAQLSNEPWLVIDEPRPEETISGGQITVSGTIHPINDSPIRFDLVKPSGAVIGTYQLLVTNPNEAIRFNSTLPYSFITTTTDIRLVIRQLSDEFAIDVILESVPIYLVP